MESDEKKINERISKCLAFTEDKGITENEWVLVWRKKKDGKCDRRKNPYWLYVHKLIKDGSADESCLIFGMELKNEDIPNKSFKIEDDKVFKEAFFNIIDEDYISNINQFNRSFDEFIERLKKEYIKHLQIVTIWINIIMFY